MADPSISRYRWETVQIGLCAFFACCVLVSPVACTMRRHQLVADAIQAGADPLGVKCSIEEGAEREPLCALYAARAKP